MTLTPEQKAEGWIEHDGKGRPVPPNTEVEVLRDDGSINANVAYGFHWLRVPNIIAYREPKP